MKKLIIVFCLIIFLFLVHANKNIKIIGFYQDYDLLKINTLFFEKIKKTKYYKIFIYDLNDNLLDIKKTENNYYQLNFINNIQEKMYIKIISYNNKNREIAESKNFYINWQLPYLKIKDDQILVLNTNNEDYEILASKNNQVIEKLTKTSNINTYDNITINLYQNDMLINKLYFIKEKNNKIIYPINNTTISYDDFYISIDTNYNCLISLKDSNNILFEDISACEYLINTNMLKPNYDYTLTVKYLYNDSANPIEEEVVHFKTGKNSKLLPVLSDVESGDVLKDSFVQLKSPNSASIYYTLDGTDPTDNGSLYKEPIQISQSTNLKAVAVKDDFNSEIMSFDYNVIEKVPFVYLSPSRQTQNLGVKRAGYSNEKIEMNKLAVILEQKLIKKGIKVYRAEQAKDLGERVKESNKLNSDIYLALHSNASTSGYPKEGKARGIQSYIASPDSSMLTFANLVQEEMMKIYEGPTNRSGVKFGTQTKMMFEINPNNENNGILLEIGFHDNYDDAHWIINNLDEISESIATAIAKYFKM